MQIILIENTQFVTELSLLGPDNLCPFVLTFLSFFVSLVFMDFLQNYFLYN